MDEFDESSDKEVDMTGHENEAQRQNVSSIRVTPGPLFMSGLGPFAK